MNPQQISVQKLNPDARLPSRAHPNDAGLDLYCIGDITLNPHEPVKVATGVAMAIPDGSVGLICDRSSMGAKGIRTLGGVVDSGYRGEVQVLLINLRNEPYKISRGDKVAQILILPVNLAPAVEVNELSVTSRAAGGFGSTGK